MGRRRPTKAPPDVERLHSVGTRGPDRLQCGPLGARFGGLYGAVRVVRNLRIEHPADAAQREALRKIILGETGEPGTNHFSVFNSTCTEVLEPVFARIEFEVDLVARTAKLHIPGYLEATGEPIINEFNGEPFHIALARTSGSFEFTYAELGKGTASAIGPLAMELDSSYAQYCVHHYDQNGLVKAA